MLSGAVEMGLRLFGGRYCLRAHTPGHRLPSDPVIALQQERGHVDVQGVEGQGGYWFALYVILLIWSGRNEGGKGLTGSLWVWGLVVQDKLVGGSA